jgi:hypothetical protein
MTASLFGVLFVLVHNIITSSVRLNADTIEDLIDDDLNPSINTGAGSSRNQPETSL